MDWLPALASQGGPWAILVSVVGAVCFLYFRGAIMSSGQVDKIVNGYKDTTAALEKELAFYREAGLRKDATIQTQAEQLSKLMAYSAVGTHALDALLEEARKRGRMGETGD